MADENNTEQKATAPDATALAAARTEGAQAERARQKGILEHAEAKNRPVAARSLAMNTDLSVEAAGAALAAMAEETKTDDKADKGGEGEGEQEATTRKPSDGMNHFKQAMDNSKQPEVGSDGEGGQEQSQRPSRGRAALAAAGYVKAK